MRLDRRAFIRLLGTAGASAALSPLSAISIDLDHYRNARLGLELDMPRGWHILDLRDFDASVDATLEGLADPGLLQELREISGDPVLVVARDRVDRPDRLNPSIQVYASPPEPLEDPSFQAFAERCADLYLDRYHPDAELESGVRPVDGMGAPAVRFTFRSRIVNASGPPFDVRVRMLLARSGRADFSLSFAGAADGPDAEDEALQRALATVRFA